MNGRVAAYFNGVRDIPKSQAPNPKSGTQAVPSPTVWFFGFGAWCLFVIWNLVLAISPRRGARRPAHSGHDVSCPYSPSSLLPVEALFWWHRLSSLWNNPRISAWKVQITNHKFQTRTKFQALNPKPGSQAVPSPTAWFFGFGAWCLFVTWNLVLGISPRRGARRPAYMRLSW